jgi:guanosine-3',5'-bis(diphosphate) 3'-pyrophosphohydrolase
MNHKTSELLRALHLAAERHRGQRRKGQEGAPYINHLIEVAWLLAEVGGVEDADTLVAAVFHDIVEDTPTPLAEVVERFGPRVGFLVEALTDDKSLPQDERRRRVLGHLAQIRDPTVHLIKLADLCSNIGAVPREWPPGRLRRYFDWTRRAADLCAGASPALHALFLRRWRAARELAGLGGGMPEG